ncbi:MAG: GDP-mannose 4,6-dehydratase [Planctomycetota bacterium]
MKHSQSESAPFQRVLITGAAGFIGSTLLDRLLAKNVAVVGIDNFDPYYAPTLKWNNLNSAIKNPNFQLFEGDILDASLLRKVFSEYDFDVVVHLAAKAGVRPSIVDPASYFKVNVEGTLNLLDRIRDTEHTRLVMASSSSVYGNNLDAPFAEDAETSKPVSPYAASKKAGEVLAHSYFELYGIPMSLLRFFTVYGPRQRPEMAIAKFFRLVREKQTVPMFGDGSTARDYTFVEDIVDGIELSMQRTQGFEIFNLGNSNPVSLRQMIAFIGNTVGEAPRIDQQAEQAGDVTLTCADITKAKTQLGYKPSTSLEKGLAIYHRWLQLPKPEGSALENLS